MQNDPKIYLAPIKGVTDSVFRDVFPKYFHGVDCAVAPFVTVKNISKLKDRYKREFDLSKNIGIKTVPQILSNSYEEFLSIANMLSDIGYETVNWNLGCPYPMVINRGKGAALLENTEKVDEFFNEVMAKAKPKISVKLRLGLHSSKDILELMPIFNRYSLGELIIHARIADQMYLGSVDLDGFESVLSLSTNPVVYNGDISSLDNYKVLVKRFPLVKGWMIGRGLLNNPFLAEEIKIGKIYEDIEKIEKIRMFVTELSDKYNETLSGPIHLSDKMKSLWIYLSSSFEDSKKLQKRINKISDNRLYYKFAKEFFESEPKLVAKN